MTRIIFDHVDGTYKVMRDPHPIKTIRLTPENASDYYLKQYSNIFSDYNPKTDHVRFENNISAPALVLWREEKRRSDPLSPGVYFVAVSSDWELYLRPLELNSDKYISLSNAAEMVLKDVTEFFTKREKYKKLDVAYRRGALIYGPPGNGKTTCIKELANSAADTGLVVLIFSSGFDDYDELVGLYGAIDSKVLIVLEELTERIERNSDGLLSFLDGELSWEDAYIIGTTNYPEQLNPNLTNRPGRFDLFISFDNPDRDQREQYLSNFMVVPKDLLRETEGFSISYLRELVIQCEIWGKTWREAINYIRESSKDLTTKKFSI